MNKFFLLGAAIITALFYFVALPPIKDFFAAREKADLDRQIGIAELQADLARKKAEANLKEQCSASNVKPLINTISDTDGGTKAHAQVTATILAKAGYFILAKTVTRSSNGSRDLSWEKPSAVPHKLAKTAGQKATFLKSASLTVKCNDHNRLGGASCTSTATVSGQMYHNDCIKYILDGESAQMSGG